MVHAARYCDPYLKPVSLDAQRPLLRKRLLQRLETRLTIFPLSERYNRRRDTHGESWILMGNAGSRAADFACEPERRAEAESAANLIPTG